MTDKYQKPFAIIRNVPLLNDLEKPSTDKKIILYQGVLNVGRGLEIAIEAMADIENMELHLAGEGDLSSELRHKVHQLSLESKVKFLGYLEPKELKIVTSKAYIGLNLLEANSLNYYYSLANKTFDYIHAEVPAIHMKFPEYEALQKKFDCLVTIPKLNKISLVKIIQQLQDDQKEYLKLKNACSKAREVLNWHNEEQQLIEIYQNLYN